MIALDGEHYSWFLLEENGQLFLDTVCSYSAVDYMFLLEMTDEEASLFGKNGRPYLDDLAQRIRSSAPGVRGNKSPFKARSLVMTPARKRADEAIDAWYANKQT
ncbi:MAG: hypothetical protein EOO77_37250 [Oxalobacteraceae bacterium]|nr:MAG: hypothetical protein EOO77_37250 [Oxalobacteraceae bacterium]